MEINHTKNLQELTERLMPYPDDEVFEYAYNCFMSLGKIKQLITYANDMEKILLFEEDAIEKMAKERIALLEKIHLLEKQHD